MAYELLKQITDGVLPLTMTAQTDIEKLRVLRDAGYVKAAISLPGDGPAITAVVTAVTPLGRTAMRYFGSN